MTRAELHLIEQCDGVDQSGVTVLRLVEALAEARAVARALYQVYGSKAWETVGGTPAAVRWPWLAEVDP